MSPGTPTSQRTTPTPPITRYSHNDCLVRAVAQPPPDDRGMNRRAGDDSARRCRGIAPGLRRRVTETARPVDDGVASDEVEASTPRRATREPISAASASPLKPPSMGCSRNRRQLGGRPGRSPFRSRARPEGVGERQFAGRATLVSRARSCQVQRMRVDATPTTSSTSTAPRRRSSGTYASLRRAAGQVVHQHPGPAGRFQLRHHH